MIFLTSYDIIDRLRKKLKIEYGILLRYDSEKTFNKGESAIDPSTFIKIISELSSLGYGFIGGFMTTFHMKEKR